MSTPRRRQHQQRRQSAQQQQRSNVPIAVGLVVMMVIGIAAIEALSVIVANTGSSSRKRDKRLGREIDAFVCNCTNATTTGISGDYTPVFSSSVRYTGSPMVSTATFFQVGDLITVQMTIFGISSPAGAGVNSINFDLPTLQTANFPDATIIGFGTSFRVSTMVRDAGYVIQVTGTKLVQWKSRNLWLTTAVPIVIPLTFTYTIA